MQNEQLKLKQKNTNTKPTGSKKSPVQPANEQSPLLQHYRNIGNQGVQRMLEARAIQAKLKVGQPNDKYEQEADSVADRVVSMNNDQSSMINGQTPGIQPQTGCPECPEGEEIQSKPLAEQITPLVQRQVEEEKEEDEEIKPKLMDNQQLQRQELPEEEEEEPESVQAKLMGNDKLQRQELPKEEEEEEEVQFKAAPGNTPKVTPNIESNINSMKGSGQPLSESTRNFFEPRFGADFSSVRLHNDSRAAQTAQDINARAFTTGKDIAFNSGQYSPNTTLGKSLLAHELTHVVQQNNEGKYIQCVVDPKLLEMSITKEYAAILREQGSLKENIRYLEAKLFNMDKSDPLYEVIKSNLRTLKEVSLIIIYEYKKGDPIPKNWVVTLCHRRFNITSKKIRKKIFARHCFVWFHDKKIPVHRSMINPQSTLTYDDEVSGEPDPNPRMGSTVCTMTYKVNPNKVKEGYKMYSPDDLDISYQNCCTVAYKALKHAGATPEPNHFPKENQGVGLPDSFGRGPAKKVLEYSPFSDLKIVKKYSNREGVIDPLKVPNNLEAFETVALCRSLIKGFCVGTQEYAVLAILERQSDNVVRKTVNKLTPEFFDSGLDGWAWDYFLVVCSIKYPANKNLGANIIFSERNSNAALLLVNKIKGTKIMNRLSGIEWTYIINSLLIGRCDLKDEKAIIEVIKHMGETGNAKYVHTYVGPVTMGRGVDGKEWKEVCRLMRKYMPEHKDEWR